MFAKKFLQKAVNLSQNNVKHGNLKPADLDPQIVAHYGIPPTSSILAFDPIQRLLAVGTLDGRIKIIGGDGIEGLLISTKQMPFRNLEFLQNQGFLVSISNDNDIQVWNLKSRCQACSSQWQSNITAFSVISGSHFMYIGDEYGVISVMKYDAETDRLSLLPYNLTSNLLTEAAGYSFSGHQTVVGVLSQPCSSGNRVLIAYESGLIILWDVSEGQILFVGGGKDLQLKDEGNFPSKSGSNVSDDTSEYHLQDKEISSLCWASSDGSVLAVGYVDGDILFWNTPTPAVASSKAHESGSSKNVVKLQLSSSQRRLPIVVLHWSTCNPSSKSRNGQLFIYGGDEIGSEEVLTVLGLEWLSGTGALKCVGRLDLSLRGSFADMILLPSVAETGDIKEADLFVLTNPGQLFLYDAPGLSDLLSKQERKSSFHVTEFPLLVPIADPTMTVAKLCILSTRGNSLNAHSEVASVINPDSVSSLARGIKWPLTGGLPSQSQAVKDNCVYRLYIAGYNNGSIRIWDATCPILSLICVLEGKVQGIKVSGLGAPISTLNFCAATSSLAIGDGCGLVCIYDLHCSSKERNFHYVTEAKREVHHLPKGTGPQCKSIFSLTNSSVQALEFANSGAKIAVGYECGHVAVLDVTTASILFFKNNGPTAPIISLTWTTTCNLVKSPKHAKHSETKDPVNSAVEAIFILTKDSHISVIDASTGYMISPHPFRLKKEALAISMYVLDGVSSVPESINEKKIDIAHHLSKDTSIEIGAHEKELMSYSESGRQEDSLPDALILLCCENQLHLYSKKTVIQGNNKAICKVRHAIPCCWTTTFKKDGEVCGLILVFQNGDVEIRSFPNLELVKKTSLMSMLRWNYKTNMDRTMSSTDHGQIALVNGSEVAFLSLLVGQNNFGIPESLPCLHDEVLAAAADAAFRVSPIQRKKGAATEIPGGMVKGYKGGKGDIMDTLGSRFSHLESIFLKCPFKPSDADNQEVMELNIDDIVIDETPPVAASSHGVKHKKKEKETDRAKLLGPQDDFEPKIMTPQEIRAKYRKNEDASTAAAHARNKLLERQEKLERMSKRTEELQNGAEDFASLANELVKTLENRKWWQL